MTVYFTTAIDMTAVARQVACDGEFDELFNQLGDNFSNRKQVLQALEKRCGSELDDGGKNFLLAIADFVDQQFPGER